MQRSTILDSTIYYFVSRNESKKDFITWEKGALKLYTVVLTLGKFQTPLHHYAL